MKQLGMGLISSYDLDVQEVRAVSEKTCQERYFWFECVHPPKLIC